MNKTYKTIILITFLIALFFFGKWVWQVIPHSKTVEDITTGWSYYDGYYKFRSGGLKVKHFYCSEMDYDDEHFDVIGSGTCYIKRKVRTN